ncbi:hypothetical protein ACIBI3_02730 [Actinomadura luteofluorescens]|uniref:hypothetical protein n=1 Tax=Actinomadura luteofluorescens TaxID=46163 RepID=UPI00347D7A81
MNLHIGLREWEKVFSRIGAHKVFMAARKNSVVVEHKYDSVRMNNNALDPNGMSPPRAAFAQMLHDPRFKYSLGCCCHRDGLPRTALLHRTLRVRERLTRIGGAGTCSLGQAIAGAHGTIRPRALLPLNTRQLIDAPRTGAPGARDLSRGEA